MEEEYKEASLRKSGVSVKTSRVSLESPESIFESIIVQDRCVLLRRNDLSLREKFLFREKNLSVALTTIIYLVRLNEKI